MGRRLFAMVTQSDRPPHVRHYRGLPPELTGDEETRQQLPRASALLIEGQSDGIYVFRLTPDGKVVGDTWHQTMEDAKQQAKYEYGEALTEWEAIPEDVTDPIRFILARVT